jgi:hypothetical protein
MLSVNGIKDEKHERCADSRLQVYYVNDGPIYIASEKDLAGRR